jgi:beta-lactamase regulating signal transducer with metallopeptidase domain
VWAAGVLVLLVRRVAAVRALRRLGREAHPLTAARWRTAAAAAAADVGLRRPVTLLRGTALTVPVTWGVRRPVVLLPEDADGWDDARRRLVLLHELAHAARGDVLVLWLAQCAVAAFWFDPLVWRAARRLTDEAERAADDAVLRAGTAPSTYVAALVEIAPPARRAGLRARPGRRARRGR